MILEQKLTWLLFHSLLLKPLSLKWLLVFPGRDGWVWKPSMRAQSYKTSIRVILIFLPINVWWKTLLIMPCGKYRLFPLSPLCVIISKRYQELLMFCWQLAVVGKILVKVVNIIIKISAVLLVLTGSTRDFNKCNDQ